MKTETVEKANKLLSKIKEVENALERITMVEFMSGIEITSYIDSQPSSRQFIINFAHEGLVDNFKYLLDRARGVTAYFGKMFRDQMINILKIELSELQKELENLKDE